MLEAARRLRSPGVSQRTGRKLRRRSVQPSKERQQFIRVLFILGFLFTAVVVGFASWYLTRLQESKVDRDSPPSAIPTVLPGR
ncbi:MAG: hypothetical protein ACKV19_02865 [Verrucomicrobiales bacterium]